jgi:hypothetical protein
MRPCEDRGGYRKFGWKSKSGLLHTGHDYNVVAGSDAVSRWIGEVVFSDWVSGFGSYGKEGGVIVIKHEYEGRILYGIYGHIVRMKSERIGVIIPYITKNWRADHLHHGIWDHPVWQRPKVWGYISSLHFYKNPLLYN